MSKSVANASEGKLFEPVYTLAHYARLYCCWALGAGCVVATWQSGQSRMLIYVVLALALYAPVLLGVRHVRSIVFNESLVVVRGIFRDRYYNYPAFYEEIKRAGRFLPLGDWKNRVAFAEMVDLMREQGEGLDPAT